MILPQDANLSWMEFSERTPRGKAAHNLDEYNGELGSAKLTFKLASASRLGCIAYLIDHTLQMRADLFRNLK
jgi:hypothetical protein